MAQITSGSLTIVDVTDGAAGLNNTTVFLYQRAASAPDKPTGNLTYTFATASITGALEGWTQSIDDLSGSDPIWMIAAVASSNGKTDIIESSEWAGPIKMAQNGQDGQPGAPGTPGTPGTPGAPGANGLNQATIFIYKRDDSATTPSKTTYTFVTGDFTTPSGWSKTIPTEPKGKPCWVTSAIAIGAEATAELNWAAPSVLVEDGSNGKNGISPVVTATENGVKIVDSEGNETYITNGANGTSYYTFVRYSKNANGSGYVATPTSETIYIGVYSGTKNSPPAYNDSGWTWSKYVGADGKPGEQGPRGVQGVSVVSTRELYYLKTNSTDPVQITNADQIHTTDDVNQWTSVVPTYIGSGKYYTCIETKLDNGTVWGAPIENKGLTDANANATQAIEIAKGVRQHFFWLPEDVSTNVPSGAYIAEENEETFKAGPTKGNVLTRSDGIWIRNGVDKLATLQGNGLTFLVPTGTYKGQKSVSLNGTGLTFYNIGSSNSAAATLASDGLQITNGSVVLGTTGGTAAGNVTLSNKNFTRSINGTSHNDLRFAIGSKFGVASDGTLYSSGLDSVASRVDKTEAHLIGMYATSSTAAGTAAKVATITPAIPSGTNWELSTGTTITVKFTNANTTASPTLNVNSKGAKPIKTYANGNLTEAEYKWAAGSTFTFTYNGTNWLMQDGTASVRMNSAETSISNNADAIILRATKTEAYQLAQPNLSPWFSYSPYKINDYWTTGSFNSLFTYTDMGDGWVRVQCTNNTSAVVRSDPRPIRCESIQPNSDYTFLYEVRNNHSTIGSTTDSNIYVVQNNNSQFWGGNCKKNLEGDRSDTYIVIKNLPQDSNTPYIKRFVKTSEPEDSSHWTGTVDGLGAIVQRCAVGDTIDYELRISIYEGEYAGPYKPYSGTQLYASEAELKITNDNVLIKATKDDTTAAQGGQHLIQSLINVAPEGIKIAANKIEIDGTATFNAIKSSADAAYDAKGAASSAVQNAVGGFTILWDSNAGTTYAGGEAKICKLDPETGTVTQAAGWAMWNGVKRTVPNVEYNPNSALPYNIPVYLVLRLSSATSTTGTIYPVWYASGWKYNTKLSAPAAADTADWTWVEATDMVLGKCVETASEAVFTECETYNPPRSFKAISSITTTAASAQATANAAAPKTSAVSEEQYIYISKASGTSSVDENNTWVTETGYKPDTWTTKRPAYDSSYPVLFVAKQKKVVSGTVTCTTPLKDDTTTIIDGGHITTGTIDASKVTVTNINASNIKAGTISVGYLPDAALNSNIKIGGRNLAKGTSDEWRSYTITDGTNKTAYLFGLVSSGTTVLEPLYISDIQDAKVGDKIQISFDIKFSSDWVATGTGTKRSYIQGNKNHNGSPWASMNFATSEWGGQKQSEIEAIMASESKEGYINTWFLITQDMIDGTYSGQLMSNIRFDYYSGTVSVRRVMVEKGDKATTWAPAPEDVQTDISNTNSIIAGVREDLTITQGDLSKVDSAVDEIDDKVAKVSKTASETAGEVVKINQKYDELSNIVDDYNNLRNYYLDFNTNPDDENAGLTIGARNTDGSDNAFKTQITNNELAFLQGGNKVAWINSNQLNISQGVIESELRVGNFVIFDEDGALNIKYAPLS